VKARRFVLAAVLAATVSGIAATGVAAHSKAHDEGHCHFGYGDNCRHGHLTSPSTRP
jgi:hypothetical protein